MDNTERINKYLANLGLCSRRNVKEFLQKQMVTVNGKRVKKPGTRIDPKTDDIHLNGQTIKPPPLVYYALNKPKGIISTTADEQHRKNVTSFIPTKQRIYPVGRLDKDTTGLILLTNDGELTQMTTHPKYHVEKTYKLTIVGKPHKNQLHALRHGVLLRDGITAPAEVKLITEGMRRTVLEMTIHEGRNRQIRRMCETVGVSLLELQRVTFGPVQLGSLQEGKYRELTKKEIELLKKHKTPGHTI